MSFWDLFKSKRRKAIEDIQNEHVDVLKLTSLEQRKEALQSLLLRTRSLHDRPKIEEELLRVHTAILGEIGRIEGSEKRERQHTSRQISDAKYRLSDKIRGILINKCVFRKDLYDSAISVLYRGGSKYQDLIRKSELWFTNTQDALHKIRSFMQTRELDIIPRSNVEEERIRAIWQPSNARKLADQILNIISLDEPIAQTKVVNFILQTYGLEP